MAQLGLRGIRSRPNVPRQRIAVQIGGGEQILQGIRGQRMDCPCHRERIG